MRDLDSAVVYVPRRGQTFHLIHWAKRGGDWIPETVVGTYLCSDSKHWAVNVAGRQVVLDRSAWAPFEP